MFKVGDKVRINRGLNDGSEGVITAIKKSQAADVLFYVVKVDGVSGELPYAAEELTPIPATSPKTVTVEMAIETLRAWHQHSPDAAIVETLLDHIDKQAEEMTRLQTENAHLLARVEKLEAALQNAIDLAEEAIGYVSPYFVEKHGLADQLAEARAALEVGISK